MGVGVRAREESLSLMNLQADYRSTTFHKQRCEASDTACTVRSAAVARRRRSREVMDPDVAQDGSSDSGGWC